VPTLSRLRPRWLSWFHLFKRLLVKTEHLYATNKYKKSGPMLYLIIHTHDVNTEGTKTIVPTYTSSKKTKKRFKKDINNSVLKYFRNCAVETQR